MPPKKSSTRGRKAAVPSAPKRAPVSSLLAPSKSGASAYGFFRSIIASVYDPAFYRAQLKEASFGRSLWFLLRFNLLLVSVFVIFIGTALFAHRQQIENVIDQVTDLYPEELVLTMQDGQLSTNVTEPYFVTMPEAFKDRESKGHSENEFDSLAVFDTSNAFSVPLYQQYRAVLWFGKDFMALSNEGQVRYYPYDNVPNGVMSKAVFDAGVHQIWDKVKGTLLLTIAVLAVVFGTLFLTLFRLFYNLLLALCIWIVVRLLGLSSTYSDAYALGLYAITLPTVVVPLLMAIGVPLFTGCFSVISLVVVGVNFNAAKQKGLLKV